MSLNKKTSFLIIILVIAIIFVGWRLLSKGGLLTLELPKPQNLNLNSYSSADVQPQQSGEVLGENSDYTNPLKDIYVNPFEK